MRRSTKKSSTATSTAASASSLEQHFAPFREQTIGHNQEFASLDGGTRPILYADWTASGRLYRPIEETLSHGVGPFVANTHTEASVTGTAMTMAYHEARDIIKQHVNAKPQDVLMCGGSGMTALINKWQRMLGLRIPSQVPGGSKLADELPPHERPVVFITHMEHHSNHTSWEETIADLVIVPPDDQGLVSPAQLEKCLQDYQDRPLKIGSFTACSNVTGICTPYHELARTMHQHGGYCIVDFAASAPYVHMDMHPANDPQAHLDALLFSPHKFLGGPGACGVLVVCGEWYNPQAVPDAPGGGTVDYTSPWGGRDYCPDPETREDGGTPPFLQTIRTAMAIKLKDEMGVSHMLEREEALLARALPQLRRIPGLCILDDQVPAPRRLGIVSFAIGHELEVHYNLLVRLLNDRFGVQVRGGCSCAGTYGHHLFQIGQARSLQVRERILAGDLSTKPGWVRLSLHPTMTNRQVDLIVTAIAKCALNYRKWKANYTYDPKTNDFTHKNAHSHNHLEDTVKGWFDMSASTGSTASSSSASVKPSKTAPPSSVSSSTASNTDEAPERRKSSRRGSLRGSLRYAFRRLQPTTRTVTTE